METKLIKLTAGQRIPGYVLSLNVTIQGNKYEFNSETSFAWEGKNVIGLEVYTKEPTTNRLIAVLYFEDGETTTLNITEGFATYTPIKEQSERYKIAECGLIREANTDITEALLSDRFNVFGFGIPSKIHGLITEKEYYY